MLKKMLITAMVFLVIISNVSAAITIQYCKSGNENWKCDTDKTCECKVVENCTQGNLIVYKLLVSSPSCLPKISSTGIASINWTSCGSPLGTVKIKADCNEGQSDEVFIDVNQPSVTTTTLPSSITTTTLQATTTTLQATTTTLQATTTTRLTTTTVRSTTTTLPTKTSSSRNVTIGILLILFALIIIAVVVYLKNKDKLFKR